MAYTYETMHIEKRLIKLATGEKSQTVNVCDSHNIQGKYEQVYRIRERTKFTTIEEINQNAKTVNQLHDFVSQRAVKEGPRDRRR